MGGGGAKPFGAFPKIKVLVLSPVPKYAHRAYFQVMKGVLPGILSLLTLVSIVVFFTTSEALTGEHLFLCMMMQFLRFGRRLDCVKMVATVLVKELWYYESAKFFRQVAIVRVPDWTTQSMAHF